MTLADNNSTSVNCLLNGNMTTASLANILVVRNVFMNPNFSGLMRACTISGCLSTVGNEPGCTVTQLGLLQFVSSETAPFDYHIQMFSTAIDAGTGGAGLVDFDGDPRPKGAAPDVGADEAF